MSNVLETSLNFTPEQDSQFQEYLKLNEIDFSFDKRQWSDYIFHDISIEQAFEIGIQSEHIEIYKRVKK